MFGVIKVSNEYTSKFLGRVVSICRPSHLKRAIFGPPKWPV